MDPSDVKVLIGKIINVPPIVISDDHPEVLALSNISADEVVEKLWNLTDRHLIDDYHRELGLSQKTADKPSPGEHWSNVLTFCLNGKTVTIENPDPRERLSAYLRHTQGLTGTKVGCAKPHRKRYVARRASTLHSLLHCRHVSCTFITSVPLFPG